MSSELPIFEEIVATAGLYAPIRLQKSVVYFREIALESNKTIDCYCIGCEQVSTFRKMSGEEGPPGRLGRTRAINNPDSVSLIPIGAFLVVYQCQRILSHFRFYYFHYDGQFIQKIGQYPSIADTASPDIKRFRPVLDSKLLNDLSRAVGLYAHGIGAGAFVYLRRIFESLINSEWLAAKSEGVSLDRFETFRLNEKVEALKERLPPELVAMKDIYGVLSAGIHELDEETCKRYFPAMLASIELILDGHLEILKRKKHVDELQKALEGIRGEVSQAKLKS